MAGFLYFLPRSEPSAPSLDAIAAAGLGYAFDTQPEAVTCRMNSPCGLGPGFVLGDQSRMGDYSVKYAPAEQEWRKLPCGCAVGWYRDAGLPGPEDLAKAMMLPGYVPMMADGRQWQCPKVRNVDDAGQPDCALPAVLTMDETGAVGRGGPVAKYRELWDETAWCWEAFLSGEEIDEQRAVETAGKLLGANYYVSAFELCLLEVFSEVQSPEGLLSVANCVHDYLHWKMVIEENNANPKNSECQAATPGDLTPAGAAT